MKPSYLVYECENCGATFYRNVAETLIDDVDHVEVKLELLPDGDGLEEFPRCACVGGDAEYVLDAPSE